MEGALIALLILVAIAALVGGYYLKQERIKAFHRTATGIGFQYSTHDPFGMGTLPFELFRRGEGRGTENAMWGTHQGHEVRAFDYWYYTTNTDSKGNTNRTYHRFSCAAVGVPVFCPSTSISKESLLTRLADFVGMRDIEFESEEFNRRMQVQSNDRKFANYLIDARMMQWLLDAGPWSFHLSGEHLIAVVHRLRPTEFPQLIQALVGFREQIPNVVFETYG